VWTRAANSTLQGRAVDRTGPGPRPDHHRWWHAAKFLAHPRLAHDRSRLEQLDDYRATRLSSEEELLPGEIERRVEAVLTDRIDLLRSIIRNFDMEGPERPRFIVANLDSALADRWLL
jgi:hypothetical protein